MYFYDLSFDDKKIVFPEYMTGEIVVLNSDFTIDEIIYEECHYGRLFLGVYTVPTAYIFTIYKSGIIRKYIKSTKSFVDVEIRDLPQESEIRFKHDEIFMYKDKNIIITDNNDILISDPIFSEVQYVKSIYKGRPHTKITEDDEALYIPIDKTIYHLSKEHLEIEIYNKFEQCIDVLFKNKKGLWCLTNDLKLENLNDLGHPVNLKPYVHFFGNKEKGQTLNFINAYGYKEKILFIPCYCDNLLLFDTMSNHIMELVIEKEIENSKTLSRKQRKNMQKYIASCQRDRYVFLLSSSSEAFYLFDFETLLFTELPKGINDSSIIEIELKHKKILYEQSGIIDIENYVQYVAEK